RMGEQRAGTGGEARVALGHDASEGLERLRHHATVGIGQLEVETGAIARGAERFGRDAAPAPVAVARQLGCGGHTGRAVRLGQGDGGLGGKAKRGLVSLASSWAAARAPPNAPRVVSAWTATFTSRSVTSGSARPTSVLSWNEASARSALTRTWPSRSPSSGRMRAITSGGAICALSLTARVTPRSATARTYDSASASAPSRAGTARARRKCASE